MSTQKDNGRVYTKSTPLLIEEWRKFKGKKETIVVDENNPENYFSNFNYMGDTGYFSLDLPLTGSSLAYQEWGAREVSEQEFLDIVLERPTKSENEPKAMVNNFKNITDSIASLLQYKNEKYGNSALEPLEIFGGKCKVGTRLDDKLARIKNSEELRKNDVADLLGYLVLICKEKGWENFDEFKD